jgi:hypothetical protein
VSELESVRSELDAKQGGDATMILKPRPVAKPARTRAARGPLPVWSVLLGALLLAAAIGGVILFGGDGNNPRAVSGEPVELQGVASFDPLEGGGDGEEHSERVQDATDGDTATYWTTERYNSFSKPGVGLVLDAGETRELSQVAISTDTPGFTAEIRAGASPQGPFETVGASKTVGESTVWDLDDADARYYVVWITDLDGSAHVNEAEAN